MPDGEPGDEEDGPDPEIEYQRHLRELRERKGGGGTTPAEADDAEDAAPRFRKRPRRAGGVARPKAAAVSLSHLDDMDDGL